MGDSKLFCLCRAICLPEQTSASQAAKNRLKWKKFNYNLPNEHPLPSIFVLLIGLYDGKDVYEELEFCRINPDYTSNQELRNDLEFYIPQLTNFMVFHRDFAHDKLLQFFEQWSKADIYFAHRYYWYINSLPKEINHERAQEIIDNIIHESTGEDNIHFFEHDYQRFFSGLSRKLTAADYENKIQIITESRAKTLEKIQEYKEDKLLIDSEFFRIKGSDLELKPYISPFLQADDLNMPNPFTSTLIFFEDLCFAADHIVKAPLRLTTLKKLLALINKALLPSYVYVPFVKESIQHYSVLNILVEEAKIFSTKERAPYYICLELYRPQKELAHEYTSLFHPTEPKEKKKDKSFLRWAKKHLPFKSEKKEKLLSDQNVKESPEEEFKLSKVDEIVSMPMTLKQQYAAVRRSFPNIDLDGLRESTGRSSKSMVIPDSTKKNDSLILMSKEVSSDAAVNNFSFQHFYPLKRVSSENNNETPTKNPNQIKSEINTSQDDKSIETNIVKRRRSSVRKSPLIVPKISTDGCLLEPLDEEEKGSEVSRNLERDSVNTRNRMASTKIQNSSEYFFGEDSEAQAERIRKKSPFGSLKTWRLVHLIIKSGADMKEEQFAIQLIAKFEHIFKLENLKLVLSSYEILSLGENVGIVEVVKNSVTISKLKEKMYRQNIQTLNDFFINFYGKDVHEARKQFCRSLAAYSLVCYFLQIKDRHNGNIMLHKDGHIVHIDFGFFLSNSPGKGLEFERKIPFKLLNEYIEVLGGHRSKLFQKFRSLFYKGFLAARKHQEQILILVKMVYSSQGHSFPCFKTGMKAITDLEQRFYPIGVSERNLKEYCYNLINQSLDNWRAKCYDKYQYYFQGILY